MDLDINAFYFHSIILGRNGSLKVFDSILKSGKILSLNKGGFDHKNIRMNFDDEICLSKGNNLNISSDAYNLFAMQKLTLIIKGSLPGIYKPIKSNNTELVVGKTYMESEYRVKNEIDLSYVVGLNLPVSFILNSASGYRYFFSGSNEMKNKLFISRQTRYEDAVSYYEELNSIMKNNNVLLPIYDIKSNMVIKDCSDIEKIKKMR